jgi:hypothetical protein
MQTIIKLLILLSIITLTLHKRCRDNVICEERSTEKCEYYYGCYLAWYNFQLKCFGKVEYFTDCCSKDKEGKACAKVNSKGTPVCSDAEQDNLCPMPEIVFLE